MSDRSSEGVPRNVPADSASPVETSGERFRRKAHRSGLYLYAFLTVALLVCLVALTVANTHQVEFSWVVGSSTVSLVWIVICTAILGWLLGSLPAWSSAGARGRAATTEAPHLRDLVAHVVP